MSGRPEFRPAKGPKPFRENVCLSLQDNELVVTDSKARAHRFPLDKTKGGPALFCTYTVAVSRGSAPEQALADSHRLAIVRTRPDLWDQKELMRLAQALDLIVSESLADAPTGNRKDCVELFGLEGGCLQLILWTGIIVAAIAVIIYALKAVL